MKFHCFVAAMFFIFLFSISCQAQPIVIVVDPGHPSEINPGKTVVNGISELDANWRVACFLETLLKRTPGFKVRKTRKKKDELTTNQQRANFANEQKANLFIRLHCDAGKGNGFTVYFPDRVGKFEEKVGPTLEIIKKSKIAARCIHSGLTELLKQTLRDNGVHGESKTFIGQKYGVLKGSIFSVVPVVTVEMGFLTDKFDASFIRSNAGQEIIAHALLKGIMNFVQAQNP